MGARGRGKEPVEVRESKFNGVMFRSKHLFSTHL